MQIFCFHFHLLSSLSLYIEFFNSIAATFYIVFGRLANENTLTDTTLIILRLHWCRSKSGPHIDHQKCRIEDNLILSHSNLAECA